MGRVFGVAGVQMRVVPWDGAATIDKMARIVKEIREGVPWVEMILFHELCPSGVVQFDAKPDPAVLNDLIQPIPGKWSDRLCEIARRSKVWLVPGSLYEKEGDRLYNTALAISPQGEIVAKYRKIFPWLPFESEFTPGNEFCVFDVPDVGRFGLCICYDMWYPEVIRSLAWLGAEVILHPTMAPTLDRKDLDLIISQANAIANQCYFIGINGLGPWGGGYSIIVDPDGRVLQKADTQEQFLTEILDLDRVTRAREYGNLGLSQTLKQLRDSGLKFPPYQGDFADGPVFKNLGKIELPPKLL